MKTLKILDLKLTDLLSNKGLKRFRNQFSLQSDEFKNADPVQTINPNFTGKIVITDNDGLEKEYDYSNDYFIPAVSKLSIIYKKKLRVKSNVVFGTDARINFLKDELKAILKTHESYLKVGHLNSTEKALITSQLVSLTDEISDKIEDLKQTKNDKITLNMKKNQVLMLFKLLHELGLIKGITIYDLMHFVENHINFKNHSAIKNANKSLNTEISRLKTSNGGAYQLDDLALLNLIKNILKI